MAYYDNLILSETHPFRIAYKAFNLEKDNCLTQMKNCETSYKMYVDAKERLERLVIEQRNLISIMPDELTQDIIVEKLSK